MASDGEESSGVARWIGPAVVFVTLGAALALLAHELRNYHYAQVAAALHAIPNHYIIDALVLTVVAYAILPLYDWLAIIYAGERLPFALTAFSSGIAYGLSQTLGFPLVTSSAV